jgi:hypothetical protein
MRRTTIILILFLLVVGGVIALTQFVRSQPPLELRVAVHPLALDWVTELANSVNDDDPLLGTQPVRFVVEAVEDIDVWLDTTGRAANWTADDHPVVWIPAWSTSVNYATRQPYQMVRTSLARTPLVWGGFQSRVNALSEAGAALDWDGVAGAAAQGIWAAINPDAGLNGNFTLAFSRPSQTTAGLGVLLSGAAAFRDTIDLVSDDITATDYRDWITPVLESVPNYNTLGSSPALTMATRGASVGAIALLPEADWLRNLRGALIEPSDPLVLAYPEYPFILDFPMAVWNGALPTGAAYTQAQIDTAVARLITALTNESGQAAAQRHGLRPATIPLDGTSSLFAAGVAYGAQPDLDLVTFVSAPSLNDVQRLLTFAGNIIR